MCPTPAPPASTPPSATPPGTPADEIRILESLQSVDAAEWNSLTGGQPVLRHEFLHALHESGCASERSGWLPQYVTAWRNGRLAGAMPLYLKAHSYGEYVFDWAWADAYARSGLRYYPKLLSAVPFSPITGSRLMAGDAATRARLVKAALQLAGDVSSLHILFPPESEARELAAAGLQLRRSVQFHWTNRDYATFDAFLADLSSAKRKKIRQERRRVADSGVKFRRLVGADITDDDWRFFTRCYESTYHAHHSSPYLNLDFFRRVGASMPENLLLIIADFDGMPLASALNIFTQDALYGRYWGAVGHVPLLHFEACYYQALEFCIERGIRAFEGGAQGEHKLARGFLPSETWSAHWLKHPEFSNAVQRFLERESAGVERYVDELNERSPFKTE